MNLATKRQVIECLLCCGDPGSGDVHAYNTGDEIGCNYRMSEIAMQAWRDALRDHEAHDYSRESCADDYTEAAFRLIESSPTLIREWFARPADPAVTYEVRLHTVATRGIHQNTAHLCTGRGATPDEAYADALAQGGAR